VEQIYAHLGMISYLPKNVILKNVLLFIVKKELKFNSILHLTARRICKMQAEVIDFYSNSKLLLLCKWGFDGSSG
jgi:hypothetical protein